MHDMSRVFYKFGGRWSGSLIIPSGWVREKEAEVRPLSDDQHPGVLVAFQAPPGCNIDNTFDPYPKMNYPTLSLFLSNELTLTHRLDFFRP